MSSQRTGSDVVTNPAPFGQVRRLRLLGVPGVVGRARDFIADVLSECDPSAADATATEARERAEDILLVVSELVSNAVAHGGGAQELAVTVEGRALTVAVTDRETAPPTPLSPREAVRPGGRGLHVVGLLSREWGTTQHASGKTVWAVLDR